MSPKLFELRLCFISSHSFKSKSVKTFRNLQYIQKQHDAICHTLNYIVSNPYLRRVVFILSITLAASDEN